MNYGSCGTATLFNLLCILFLFCSGVDAQSNSGNLLPRCPNIQAPWWGPLTFKFTKFPLDPCGMFDFAKHKLSLNCCFKNGNDQQSKREKGNDKDSDPDQPCGPCNLQTYNLASACLACDQFANSTPPSDTDININNNFPSFASWTANGDPSKNRQNLSLAPQWTNINVSSSGMFNVQQALLAASNEPPASAPASGSSMYIAGPSMSSPVPTAPTTDRPGPSAGAAQNSSGSSLATSLKVSTGAIAGGVIGGLLFLALVALGIFYLLRRRRRHRSAPSAQFMPVSEPSHVQEEDPPQFGPGSWRPPPLEKVYTNTSPRGLMSNPALWERDIEKY